MKRTMTLISWHWLLTTTTTTTTMKRKPMMTMTMMMMVMRSTRPARTWTFPMPILMQTSPILALLHVAAHLFPPPMKCGNYASPKACTKATFSACRSKNSSPKSNSITPSTRHLRLLSCLSSSKSSRCRATRASVRSLLPILQSLVLFRRSTRPPLRPSSSSSRLLLRLRSSAVTTFASSRSRI
ncbi:hypothetical protein CAOG_008975 [Capsaspora owczarzaki ATCC 30864]|uniref:Uncharacterized protein n=1 Tax=Capsaspora owczarzaki (strain ATCC 30864) TaxID=595528 RepID=A0A0D2X4G4_CAPO3|nr:hypothetical protein CAOG_008975 [Capsaspora owczarzaki ATCC 30864]